MLLLAARSFKVPYLAVLQRHVFVFNELLLLLATSAISLQKRTISSRFGTFSKFVVGFFPETRMPLHIIIKGHNGYNFPIFL